jgi:hypothetical protein
VVGSADNWTTHKRRAFISLNLAHSDNDLRTTARLDLRTVNAEDETVQRAKELAAVQPRSPGPYERQQLQNV